MADETIRIVIDDESSKDDLEALGREVVSQADTGLPTGGIQEPPDEPPNFDDFEADLSSLNAVLEEVEKAQQEALQDLIGTTENIASAGADVEGFRDAVTKAAEELSTLVDGIEEVKGVASLSEGLEDLNLSTDALFEEFQALANSLNIVENEWDRAAKELESTTEKIGKSGLQIARQTANLARAAGAINSNTNQIVAAGTALAKGLDSPTKAAVALVVATAAVVLTFKALDKAAESLAKEIGGFSADVARATAEKKVAEIEDRIRLAGERGGQVAELILATNDMNIGLREFRRDILAVLIPLGVIVTKSLTTLINIWNNSIGGVLGFVGDYWEKFKENTAPFKPDRNISFDKIFGEDQDISDRVLELFNPENVGFRRKGGVIGDTEKEAQERFDEILKPPVPPP